MSIPRLPGSFWRLWWAGAVSNLGDGVLLGMAKFNRILEVDYANRCVVAQPGVANLSITKAVDARGF